ncbi:CDP-alcohol phosphatidyltransferase family protein [Pseudonocardia nematodicida]|uniref:CDP-alcohol phosphatidyltransferase family protein n=1 Tax=Pseudonocardia nematodicida TaxID=1206997 RepID=A0ABV1KFI1_9PSEU
MALQSVAPITRQLAAASALLSGVLAALVPLTGIGVVRVVAGVLLAATAAALLLRAAHRAGEVTFGPAGAVTLARGALVLGAATLVGQDGAGHVALVGLAGVALALDAVDGPVARRTGTVTALGARFDMETDALLLLVLSVHVAATSGVWWAIALGAMRYAFVAAGRVLPWLRGELSPRYSAKVVAAVQGVVLVVVATGVLPPAVEYVLLAAALAALTWSFGVSVAELWRGAGERTFLSRALGAGLLTAACAALVGALLLVPADPVGIGWPAFARLPVEIVVGAAVLAVAPGRSRPVVAVVAGLLLAAIGLSAALDAGFLLAQDRPFNPVSDWSLLLSGRDFVATTAGGTVATTLVVVVVVAAVGLVAASAGAVVRLGRIAARHRRTTLRGAAVLGAAWMVLFALAEGPAGRTVAAAEGANRLHDRAVQVPAALEGRRAFAASVGEDPRAERPEDQLLSALRGKDVVIAYVESYGRTAAVADPGMVERIGPVLDEGERALGDAGFSSRTGFLTAPITGGGSWLAHATLSSGLWIDSQPRNQELLASDRMTLPRAFADAGWETAAVKPGTTQPWPEGTDFFGFQRIHGPDGLDYAGPPFSWSPMPDQYALEVFTRREYARADRGPLMAEIALTSSHAPFTPIPPLLPWGTLGDGSVFEPHATEQRTLESVLAGDPADLLDDYLDSVGYSLETTLDWVERYGDDDLVVVLLGDHQPGQIIVGPDAGQDVPISVLTRDDAVLDRVEREWGWNPGLRPEADAPVWGMDEFRDRFLDTFSD